MADIIDEYDLTKGGTLPKYTESKVLQEKIDEYFETGCIRKRTIVSSSGEPIEIEEKRPTITGLSDFLGFADRSSIKNYLVRNKSEKLAYIIKRALQRIDEVHESNLYNDKCTGDIFYLKCRGMVEEKEPPKDDKKKPLFSIGRKKD